MVLRPLRFTTPITTSVILAWTVCLRQCCFICCSTTKSRSSLSRERMSTSQMDRSFRKAKKGTAQAVNNSSATAKKDKKPRAKVLGKHAVSADAEVAINAFIQSNVSMGVEGIKKDFNEIKAYQPTDATSDKFNANPDRNRYKDIVCWDGSRVVLTLNVPPDTDYIHANWVKMDGLDRTYIATQGPLENTISDFWRMVFQENVSIVVMLCKCEEEGKAKCVQYWPAESGSYKTYSGMFVNNKRVEKEDRFCTYTLEVLPDGCSNSNIVKLFQVIDWPDKGVPISSMSILRLLKMTSPTTTNPGPTVVHCSAGVGRTGTLIAIQTAIDRLWKGQTVSMKDIVVQMRNQRACLMQTDHQYIFSILSVMYYIVAKIPKHREAVFGLHEQFKTSCNQ